MSRAPAATATLELNDLTVRYGDKVAVDGISISAERGQILGLLGPNGAGKTSVIRALTTMVPIAAGSAVIAGNPLSDAAAVRANIGVLPESNGYPGAQSGLAYLRYYAQLFGLSRPEASSRAARLLTRMGLDPNRDRISTYSRGMRQRLGLARALLNEPAVLFLDEPTLGLDPAGKADILRQLTEAAIDHGTCVVLCSHLLDEVERVCDQVAIMHRGGVIADGTVDHVIAQAALGDRCHLRVAVPDMPTTIAALNSLAEVKSTEFDNSRPGDVTIELDPAPTSSSVVLRALLDTGVQPRSFDLHSIRLSDAFLALTAQQRASTP